MSNITNNEEKIWIEYSDSKPSEKLERFKAICAADDSVSMTIGDVTLDEDHLIILVEPEVNSVFAINLVTTAKTPVRLNYDELKAQIDEEKIILAKHSFDPRITNSIYSLTELQKARINERYEAILPLTLDLEDSLLNGYGSNAFTKAAEEAGKKVQYIYNTFYSYLRHGCRKSGLIMPQGKDANHIPNERKVSTKLGRRNTGKAKGKILVKEDFNNFKLFKTRYTKTAWLSINRTVELMLEEKYSETKVLLPLHLQRSTGTKYGIELKKPHERPTYNQFYYWLLKEFDGVLPRRDRKKMNRTEYLANVAGRTGDHGLWIHGPGEVYAVDETPMDEEAVSAFDETRRTKIGKPTFYFMKDMFSKAIVSCYITTQNPSYDTVKEVLFNAGRNKEKWLEELGIPIDSEFWKMEGMPLSLLVDKAEFHNKLSEGPITSNVPITVKFTRTGRGDDKGDVEKAFDCWMDFFRGISPAHQTKSRRDIATQLARKNACLTIPELYEIAVVYIIHYNNTHRIKDYPLTRQMKKDGVPAIPAKLWDWGMKYRPGYIQSIPEDQLYLDLLETADVTVYQDHIYLTGHKLKYVCQWTLDKGYQDRVRGQKSKKFKCRIHRSCVDFRFIVTDEGLQIATLHNHHNSFIGLSFDEVKMQKSVEKLDEEELYEFELKSKINVTYFLKEKVRTAITEKLPSSMQNIQKIRDNRMFETLFERNLQVNRLYQSACSSMSYQEPITETINDDEDDAYADFDN